MVIDTRLLRPSNFVGTGERYSSPIDTGEQWGRGLGCLSNLGIGPEVFSTAITSILQPISQYLQAKEQSKTADKQIQLERSVLKEQKLENARSFAEQQAIDLAAVSARRRQEQVIGMYAVGGAALLLSALFIFGAVKK